MKAARVRPAEADAFIMRALCKANKAPTEGQGGKEEGQEGGWAGGEVPEALLVSSSKVPFPSAQAGWEVKGGDVGTANHKINLLMAWMLKTP